MQDPDVVKKLKEGTNDSIEYGLDWSVYIPAPSVLRQFPLAFDNSIAENGSYQLAQLAFGPKGGHLITLLWGLVDLPRADVKTELTLGYTANGEDHTILDSPNFKTSPEDRALYAKWCLKSTEMFEKGELKVCSE